MILFYTLTVVVPLFGNYVKGTHFSGAELAWRNTEGHSFDQWSLTLRFAWIKSDHRSVHCDDKVIQNKSLLTSVYRLSCNDCINQTLIAANYYCTDQSPLLDVIQGENTYSITANNASAGLSARFTGCCWRNLDKGGNRWNIWAKVNHALMKKLGRKTNASPKAGTSLIVVAVQECKQLINLRVIDSDNDHVRCRWAVGSTECGGVCEIVTGIELNKNCTITFDGTTKTGTYALPIVMEDYNSPEDLQSLSKSWLQIILQVISKSPCKKRPYFTGLTPGDATFIHIPFGTTWHAKIMAKVLNPTESIIEFVTRSPIGFIKSEVAPLENDSSTFYVNITWEHPIPKGKLNQFCFTALTSNEISSVQRCITLTTRVLCIADTSGKSSGRGEISWPGIATGSALSLPCPHGPSGSTAKRYCSKRGENVGHWEQVDDNKCGYTRKETKTLDFLAKQIVTAENVDNITMTMLQISTDYGNITSADIILITKIIKNVVSSKFLKEQVTERLLETVSNVMKSNPSSLLDAQVRERTLSSLVNIMSELAKVIKLSSTPGLPSTRVSSSIALQSAQFLKSSFRETYFLVNYQSADKSSFNKDDLELVSTSVNGKKLNDLQVVLPHSFLHNTFNNGSNSSRVAFVVYRNASLFKTITVLETGVYKAVGGSIVGGMVVSCEIEGQKNISLNHPIKLLFRIKKENKQLLRQCVFWDFNSNNGFGQWSTHGCRLVENKVEYVVCECDHLTNFAVLLDPTFGQSAQPYSDTHEKVLSIITYVGIGVSLGGIFATLLTLALFKQLRDGTHMKITIQFCISLMLTLILFLVSLQFDEYQLACQIIAVSLHYLLLVTFLWMYVLAVDLYLKFVKVLGSYIQKMMIKTAIFSWGLPVIIVSVSAAWKWDEYGHKGGCTVSGYAAYGFLFAPIVLVFLINLILFFIVLLSLLQRKQANDSSKEKGRVQLKFAIMCCFLLGFTWIFGVFAVGDARLLFQYLFCIFNSLQGFFVFYFQIARKESARLLWVGFLQGKGRRRTPSSASTYTTRKAVTTEKSGNNFSGCTVVGNSIVENNTFNEFKSPKLGKMELSYNKDLNYNK